MTTAPMQIPPRNRIGRPRTRQTDWVLEQLFSGRVLTSAIARKEVGLNHLSATVATLRRSGIEIESRPMGRGHVYFLPTPVKDVEVRPSPRRPWWRRFIPGRAN
jgi:hypothetical protein